MAYSYIIMDKIIFSLVRQKGDLMKYILIILILIFLLILWSLIEHRFIVTKDYLIKSNKLEIDSQNISFVVISDLHNRSYSKKNIKLIQKILEQKPDFVIIAGDLITKRRPCYPGNAYDLLVELKKHYPIYYAYGNHEEYYEDLIRKKTDHSDKELIALKESWKSYKDMLLKLGVHILDNDSLLLYNNRVRITGLSIPGDFYVKGKPPELKKEEIISYIGRPNNKEYQILIAHNPVYFKEYIEWGADLILSGHLHGGLIRIPFIGGVISPQVRLFPKYDGGLYKEKQKNMIVSRGAGNHSFMPRFLNPPELLKITLKAE